jgi:hypothetical protein
LRVVSLLRLEANREPHAQLLGIAVEGSAGDLKRKGLGKQEARCIALAPIMSLNLPIVELAAACKPVLNSFAGLLGSL